MVLLIVGAVNFLRAGELAEVVHWGMGFRTFFSWALFPITLPANLVSCDVKEPQHVVPLL